MVRSKWVLWSAASICAVAWAIPANAQWGAQVTGPDVFGNTTVIAVVDSDSGNGLVVQCNNKDTLDLAYISPATKSEMDELSKPGASVPAQLLVKVDRGAVEKFDADLQQWNNTYIGIVAHGRTPAIAAVIHAIGSATSQINVGASVLGNQQSEQFGTIGSTAAMNTVEKDCKLAGISPTQGTAGSPTP